MKSPIAPETLAALQTLDTCAVANAIETFQVRLRNEGYTDASIRSVTPCEASVAGYAVTARIRCSSPPMRGGAYVDRTDWWNHILTIPGPRIVVIEDVDPKPGTGAFLGEVHACILQALGCVAAVTNGSVRDVPAIANSGFKMFANHLSVSHAFVHVVDFGHPVIVGGLEIRPGDLLHADCHGVLSVPHEIVDAIPARSAELEARERKVLGLCREGNVTIERLRDAVHGIFNEALPR
jgi:4-hydroxy-4-methyl-2-oxoglutarate aldolase